MGVQIVQMAQITADMSRLLKNNLRAAKEGCDDESIA